MRRIHARGPRPLLCRSCGARQSQACGPQAPRGPQGQHCSPRGARGLCLLPGAGTEKLQPLGLRQKSSRGREADVWGRPCWAVSARATRRPRSTGAARGPARSTPPTSPATTAPFLSRSSASCLLGGEGEGQRLFLSLVFPDSHELKISKILKGMFRGADSAPPHISHVCT